MHREGITGFSLVRYLDRVSIDHGAETPPYEQLAAILRARIESGEYPAGRALPSLARLGQETGLSRNTIMRSIGVLADEGLVTRRQGWGTFVLAPDQRP